MNVLCVIPARAGSKGVKNKNIRDFKGKPLIAHTIEYAQKCDLLTKIIVSTDSVKYAEISKEYGADVPFIRPEKFAKDSSQDIDFIYHALFECEKLYKLQFKYVVLLRPTSPVRLSNLIEKGLALIDSDPNSTSLKAVTESTEHPYRHWELYDNSYIAGYEKTIHEPYNLPRQELPKLYYSAGDIEIIRRETIINGSVSGEKIIPFILNKKDVIDIDTNEDFNNALEKYDYK
ncbi:MAG: acylneuraminate cytidylyltransferase [Candidatus Marinimicrobia bacterium]|nr:acylneuraminate cytidylyltransferase [Candidatus Neomarinimicrobiota bacterium]